jgi:hypothetical protein
MTVANKRVRISDNGGTNWYTMPGNTATLQLTPDGADDTVFGQAFKSNQPTAIDGKITCNAFFKGFAGYMATLKKTGTTTAMTDEAMSLVTGKIYVITAATKRVIDPNVAYTVFDNAVDKNAEVEWVDYLNGQVKFLDSYTVTGPVTITGSYLPLATIAKANSFTLTQTADATETSDFETLQGNGGHKTFQQGLKTVQLETKGFYDVANDFVALIDGRAQIVIEINPDGTGKSVARGFFRPSDGQLSGNVGDIEAADIKFDLSVPAEEDMRWPFHWTHTSTTMPTALVKALTAWESGDYVDIQYLPDGSVGYEGETVVTEMSLSGGIDTINTFSCTFQINGGLTQVT